MEPGVGGSSNKFREGRLSSSSLSSSSCGSRKTTTGRRSRGISTVVTSAMLISAVSLMGTFLISWSGASFDAQRLSIARSVDDRVNQIRESFVVEDAWFFTNSTGSYAKVTVRNTGDVAIKVSSIYLNNTQQVFVGSQLVPKDSVQSFTFQSNWGQGKSQSLWVKTERGTEVKQVWRSS